MTPSKVPKSRSCYSAITALGFSLVLAGLVCTTSVILTLGCLAIGILLRHRILDICILIILATGHILAIPWIVLPFITACVYTAGRRFGADGSQLVDQYTLRSQGIGPICVLATTVVPGIAAGAIAGLISRHQYSDGIFVGIQRPSTVVLWLLLVCAAAANSLGEEAIWRAYLDDAISETMRPIPRIIFIAISFGLAHANGLPSGFVGIIAAGSFSLLLSYLRLKGGFWLSVTAHVFTDISLFAMVSPILTFSGPCGSSIAC
jgi:membrane protease YdiL (CAAX protease family)